MSDVRGSIWRKWDLHVHTPESIVHQYRCAADENVWEKYITELESLPEDIKVLGINDYIFIDGYKKVLKYKEDGRLQNIDLILPVIELRLNKFGGTKSHLSRINYHIIFSDTLHPDVIQSQFLNALTSKYKLSPEHETISWGGIITRESLADLGKEIKESVPEEQRVHYGDDLIEGFNNLNLDLNEINEILSRSYFKNKYLTAVGKTEWADIKWNNHSIADKKNIINNCDFVFISSPNIEHFNNARDNLTSEYVNNRLLDCSDAHRFADSLDKDRLGKCFTWLKCDATFDGLRQIRNEFGSRVFVGNIPPKLEIIRKNPTKYIKTIKIQKTDQSKHTGWFNTSLSLNHDLVAVIGNKGNGKSAIADIIGLLGNTKNHLDFSFLTKNKFRQYNLASNFVGEIEWESGLIESQNLNVNPTGHETEKVKYLPQQFIEKLCNVDDEKFEEELKTVIFSHVEEKNRLKQISLNELLKVKTEKYKKSIDILKMELSSINESIIEQEKLCSTKYKNGINEQIKSKEEELSAQEKIKPAEVEKVEANQDAQKQIYEASQRLTELNQNLNRIIDEIRTKSKLQNDVEEKLSYIERLEGYIENFKKQYEIFISSCSKETEFISIDIKEIISLNIDTGVLISQKEALLLEKELLNNILVAETDENLITKKAKVEEEINNLQNQLDEPQKKYQIYQKDLIDWQEKFDQIKDELDQLNIKKLSISNEVEKELSILREDRIQKVKDIHENIVSIKSVYEELYKPVQTFISQHTLNDEKFQLNFEVSIQMKGFLEKFLSLINQGIKGPFQGKDEGKKVLEELMESVNFNETQSVIDFVNKIVAETSSRDPKEPESINISSQLTRSTTLMDYYEVLFSLNYLQPIYSLKLGDKDLKTLSPGEKGALLLIFYLLVDKDDIPLIIDQPEENLDNQTVFNLLVPCIKEAKNRRQIVIITHNPNLAVVCDAEQIIHASMEKSEGNNIEYLSGSIENPDINRKIIDILEGTTPAFKNRESKYYISI
ncbi:TrlF family AAA-like ATPase [Bacillus infantis]|uniref:TrlF family AAA-like ATPase n=1 Tax=Bacillus infantis TaxID=324767 RepID=UPI003CF9CDDB